MRGRKLNKALCYSDGDKEGSDSFGRSSKTGYRYSFSIFPSWFISKQNEKNCQKLIFLHWLVHNKQVNKQRS